ncbi:ATP-binding protein [Neolewinella litorea]|uniref:ATP-binding protein n=1 Tax=Neolewinella litorea TaxID=2562452 RepID=A0A4S4NM15_9BACT|nr:ATP-binding protein [Neolewinella litorea]THH39401.1 ATP-binding protein [Neolewinella litorea]
MKDRTQRLDNLEAAMGYLQRLISARLEVHLGKSETVSVTAPVFRPDDSAFSHFLEEHKPTYQEYVAILLALAPQVRPDFFDELLPSHIAMGDHFPAFGGFRGKQCRGILPTGETLQFVLAGNNLAERIAVLHLLRDDHWLVRSGFLLLHPPPPGEPPMAGQLVADPEWVEQLLTGRVAPPAFSPNFPAQRVETELEWNDLVLADDSLREIGYLTNYLNHQQELAGDPGYGRHSRRGYRAIFCGPPGTGKTLTAALLGKASDRPVFRVDLSMVVSKWIGETEKNLAGLFERAESKGWILFFDEADALFSKRGEVKESRDKYANQETSFLLQRVENYDGLCILATNFRSNLDKAFTRRFEAIVSFAPPSPTERLQLWRKMLPAHLPLAPEVDLDTLAHRYELTGANIANAIRHSVYESVHAGAGQLREAVLREAIRREYQKEDRLFPADGP